MSNFDSNLLWTYEENYKDSEFFLKGCKWSPDGKCLLTACDDNNLRVYDLPFQWENIDIDVPDTPVLTCPEGGTIYDYTWYPLMDSNDPSTCVFLSTSSGSPIHLWDAYSGLITATYLPIDQVDEVMSAYSASFSVLTGLIYAGFKKEIRVFNLTRPGRESEKRLLKSENIKQTGIASSIAVHPSGASYAVGCYDKTVGVYSEPNGSLEFLLNGNNGGVTEVLFSHDGTKLFSGSRMDPEILCWDLRNPGKLFFTVYRTVTTHQRIYFDLSKDDRYLVTGSTNGCVQICDLKSEVTQLGVLTNIFNFEAHKDCVNGSSFNPHYPLLATASGQRHMKGLPDDDSDSESDEERSVVENCVKVWRLPDFCLQEKGG